MAFALANWCCSRDGSQAATASSLLVVNKVYDRGWRAMVDGAPAEILATNHVQRGVALPAGTHRVELRYDPPALRIGLAVGGDSGAAMLAVLGLAGRARLRRSRRGAGTAGVAAAGGDTVPAIG